MERGNKLRLDGTETKEASSIAAAFVASIVFI